MTYQTPASADTIQNIRDTADLAALVEQAGIDLRRSGSDLRGLCPFHDDRNPSLVLYQQGGVWRFKCYGCNATGDAIDWVKRHEGLDFPQAIKRLERQDGALPPAVAIARPSRSTRKDGVRYATAEDCLAAIRARFDGDGTETLLSYRDESGRSRGHCLRIDWSNGRPKTVRYCWLDGDAWTESRPSQPRTLFGLDRLAAADPDRVVFVTEGELKARRAAEECDLLAVSAPYGAGKAALTDWSPLRGRSVIVLPDHDESGEQHALQVAQCCRDAGAKDIRIARLVEFWPSLPQHGDIADLIDSRSDSEALAKELLDWALGIELDEPEEASEATDALPMSFLPYPADALPPPLAEFVESFADCSRVDGCLVAMPLLSGLAAAIGSTRRLQAKGGGNPWEFPSILWTAVIAPPGSGKTPCQAAALRPLEQRDKEWRLAYQEQVREHQRMEFEAKRQQAAPPPDPPIERRAIVSDATFESLAPLLRSNPRGLLLKRDELKAWFGSFDQYRNARVGSDAQQWNEIWNGGAMSIDRRSHGSTYVPAACVSITGGIQPGIFRQVTNQEHRESGLASRFLIASPPKRPQLWNDREVDAGVAKRVAQIYDRLLALKPDYDADGIERPKVIRFDPGGHRSFVAHHDALRQEETGKSEFLGGIWSKLVDHLGRLCLVLHEVRVADGDPDVAPDWVDAQTVSMAARLIRWHAREAERIEDEREACSATDGERHRLELIDRIRQNGGEATPKEVRGWFRRLRDDGAAKAALDALVAAGLGEWIEHPSGRRGGRPKTVFRLREDTPAEITRIEL